jgi:spore germination protein YaaH
MIRLLCSLLTLATLAAITPVPQRTRSAQPPEVWAFTGPWEAESDASVRANASKLDAVVTGWIALDSASAQPILPSLFPDTIRPLARTAAGSRTRPTTTRRMAIVTSWHGDRFHPETIRRLARQPEMLARAASAIASHAEQMSYRGLVLDFESLEPADVPALIRVVRAVADSAHAKGISPVTLAIPAADSEGYPTRALLGATDLLLVMLYDQHWAESEPGPNAEPTWVRETLGRRVADAGPGRIVAGLPTYGYRWRTGLPTEHISFADARRIAARAHISLERDTKTQTLRATRRGAWDMWISDAGLLRVLLDEVKREGVYRVALWRLGQEDPGIWRVLGPGR